MNVRYLACIILYIFELTNSLANGNLNKTTNKSVNLGTKSHGKNACKSI